MKTVVQRAKPYQAVLNVPGQLPTPTPCYLACDDVQAARFAVADWSSLAPVRAIERLPREWEMIA